MSAGEIGPWGPIVYLTADELVQLNKPVMGRLSQPGRRLLWSLQGPLSSAISVLAEDENPNPDGPREPYFRHGGDGTDRWHPISNEPVTEQRLTTLTVTEENLSGWQDEWWNINGEGFDEDAQPAPGDLPPTFEPLVVTASNGEFVSIHDYVSAVHPWLMAGREQILRARHVADDHYVPGLVEERLLVVAHDAELVFVVDEQEWLADLRSNFEENRRRREQGSAG
ncbi:hypothetical protein NEMBOFW57_007656 [Staphylotrichum longicolle]|uniref:Uncharacterized protein n=1 Tax=Staphylotrichum longicolle TaxID=669026 RepID=A0AAD4EV10_9PEZI|nr:hypothetical protein NEMBOFW57_007656 [Staphylotrichum longicolle]